MVGKGLAWGPDKTDASPSDPACQLCNRDKLPDGAINQGQGPDHSVACATLQTLQSCGLLAAPVQPARAGPAQKVLMDGAGGHWALDLVAWFWISLAAAP